MNMIEERVPNNHNLSVIGGCFLVIGGLIFLINILREYFSSNSEFLGLAFISLIAAFVVMYFWQKYMRSRFRCPNCKTHIPKSQPISDLPGSPIHHYCEVCKINWLLGKTPYPRHADGTSDE